MKAELLVEKAMNLGSFLTPDAIQLLETLPDEDIQKIFTQLKGATVITREMVAQVLETARPPKMKPEREIKAPKMVILKGKDYPSCGGEVEDFQQLFRSRYEKTKSLLRMRPEASQAIPFSSLKYLEEGQEFRIIGMVAEKRVTPKGHYILELEDLERRERFWVLRDKGESYEQVHEVVTDEVIGLVGIKRQVGNISFITKKILWPEFPKITPHRAEEEVYVAFISDLHVGSKMFLEHVFERFVKWLKGTETQEKYKHIPPKVSYLLIAGDICDGVGIYPKQEKELEIADVFKQYERAAELLSELPEHITVVISPGNHDAVRMAEPQPPIPEEIAKPLHDMGCVLVGNPSLLEIEGVRILMYHGRSFDDLSSEVNVQNPCELMKLLLKKRHLAPVYGGKTAVAPYTEDYMVIEEIPDVFHCGHLHVAGMERYKGVWLLCSGPFQGKTSYMRKRGIEPTPGIVPVLNLKTGELLRLHLA